MVIIDILNYLLVCVFCTSKQADLTSILLWDLCALIVIVRFYKLSEKAQMKIFFSTSRLLPTLKRVDEPIF